MKTLFLRKKPKNQPKEIIPKQEPFYPYKKFTQALIIAYHSQAQEHIEELAMESIGETILPRELPEPPKPLPLIPTPEGYEIEEQEILKEIRPPRIIQTQVFPPLQIKPKEPLTPKTYEIQITENLKQKIEIKQEIDELTYHVSELLPPNLIEEIKKIIGPKYEKDKTLISNDRLITKLTKKISKKLSMPSKEFDVNIIKYYLKRDFENFSKITPLLNDNKVQKIICNGIHKPIEIFISDKKLRTNIIFQTNQELNLLVMNLANKTNKKIFEERPILDTTLDNMKIQATLGNNFVSSTFIITK